MRSNETRNPQHNQTEPNLAQPLLPANHQQQAAFCAPNQVTQPALLPQPTITSHPARVFRPCQSFQFCSLLWLCFCSAFALSAGVRALIASLHASPFLLSHVNQGLIFPKITRSCTHHITLQATREANWYPSSAPVVGLCCHPRLYSPRLVWVSSFVVICASFSPLDCVAPSRASRGARTTILCCI